MSFQRGADPFVTIGLGKFSELQKLLESEYRKITEIPMDFKFIPDKGGGNQHRFLIWVGLDNGGSASKVKENLKSWTWSFRYPLLKINYEIKAENYYLTNKISKKYNFHKNEFGLTAELVISEIHNKKNK